MACSIRRNNKTNEIEEVFAPNGAPSILYTDITIALNNKEEALRKWAYAYTDSFNEKYPNPERDINGEPVADLVLGIDKTTNRNILLQDKEGAVYGDNVETISPSELTMNSYPELRAKLIKNLDIKVYLADNLESQLHTYGKEIYPVDGLADNGKAIYLDRDKMDDEVVAHELVHIKTNTYIEDNPTSEEVKELKRILKIAREELPKGVFDNETFNVDELVAYGLTNKRFQNHLSRIKVEDTKNLFDRFLDVIKSILGLKTKKEKNALDIVIKYGNQIIDSTNNSTAMRIHSSLNPMFGQKIVVVEGDATTKPAEDVANKTKIVDNANKIKSKYDLTGANDVQRKIVDNLALVSGEKQFVSDNSYQVLDGTNLTRISTIIANDSRFRFDGIEVEGQYALNRHWGNQLDDVISSYLNSGGSTTFAAVKKDLIASIRDREQEEGETLILSDQVIQEAMNSAQELMNQYPKSVFMTQVFLHNKTNKIGGTVDIIAIKEDGTLDVIDIKSSLNPIGWDGSKFKKTKKRGHLEGKIIEEAYDYSYTKKYNAAGVSKGSKKDRHEAQLSLYTGMLNTLGYTVNKVNIMMMHIQEIENGTASKVGYELYNFDKIKIVEEWREKALSETEFVQEDLTGHEAKVDSAINTIKEALTQQIKSMAQSNNKSKDYLQYVFRENLKGLVFTNELNELQESEILLKKIGRIDDYIQAIHNFFVGNEEDNFKNELQKLQADIIAGKFKDHPTEAVKLITYYQDQYKAAQPVLEELRSLYARAYLDQGKSFKQLKSNKNTTAYKLGEVVDNITEMEMLVKEEVPSLLSKILSEYIEIDPEVEARANRISKPLEGLKKQIEEKKKHLKKNISKVLKTKLNDEIKELEAKTEEINKELDKFNSRFNVDEAALTDLFRGGSDGFYDISMVENWLLSASSASNPIVGLYVKKVKEALEEIRVRNLETQREAVEIYKEFKKTAKGGDNVEKFNEDFIETVTEIDSKTQKETQRLSMVQKHDYNKYNKAFNKIEQEANKIHGYGTKKYWDIINKWRAENTTPLSREDETITVKGKTIVVRKGIQSTLNKWRDTLPKDEFDSRFQDAFEVDNHGVIKSVKANSRWGSYFRVPSGKYVNAKYKAIQENSSKKSYYEYILSLLLSARSKMPTVHRYEQNLYLPSIQKNKADMFIENLSNKGIKGVGDYIQYRVKDSLSSVVADEEIYGNEKGFVPRLFTQEMPINEMSKDLLSSVLIFKMSADKFKVASEMSTIGELMYEKIKDIKPNKTDSSGIAILKKTADSLGFTNAARYQKEDGNRTADLLRTFIDMQLYGQTKTPTYFTVPILGKRLDVHKVLDTVHGMMSQTSLGLLAGGISATANYLQGNTMNLLEAHAGQFYSHKDLMSAKIEYRKQSKELTTDLLNAVPRSKLGQLVNLYDPLQGDFVDKFGRKITQSNKKRAMQNTWFMLHNSQEHQVQVTSFIAHLKATKVKQNGKEISLYDAYTLNDKGNLVLKKGVNLSELGRTTSNGLMSMKTQARIHGVNRYLHGNYAKFNKTKLSKSVLGSAVEFFRKYLAPGYMKRWGNLRYDYETNTVIEGHFITFVKKAHKDFIETMKVAFFNTDTENFTDLELANVRRAAFESMIIMLLIGLTAILKAGDYDENQKRSLAYLLYPLMRLKAELLTFFPLLSNDWFRTINTPFIGMGYAKKITYFMGQLFEDLYGITLGDGAEIYKRDSGIWDKGDLKIKAKLVSLFGLTSSKLDIEQAIKVLELQKL